tara:strand:- start:112 stop:348 length:237 start_codon:yes stop_codon:yes gene_type:complete
VGKLNASEVSKTKSINGKLGMSYWVLFLSPTPGWLVWSAINVQLPLFGLNGIAQAKLGHYYSKLMNSFTMNLNHITKI